VLDTGAQAACGSQNVGIGYLALRDNTTANQNTCVGYLAGASYTTLGGNVNVGNLSGQTSTGSSNVYLGNQAAKAATTGSENVAVGALSLFNMTSPGGMTAVGKNSARDVTTGSYICSFGYDSLRLCTTGVQHTAFGVQASYSVTTGNRNTSFGYRAGFGYTGSENVFIGSETGEASSSGNFNTFVGHQAGESTIGSSNIIIGNATSIGSVSNRYVIGNSNNGTGTQDYAIAFVRSTDWSRILIGGTSIAGSSDERMKKDISDHALGLSFINRLRPVNFKWKAPSEFPTSFTSYDSEVTTPTRTSWQTGLIAQEVKAAMDAEGIETEKFDVWNEEEDGSQALSPAQLIMPLIKALQEADDKIDALTTRIEALES